MSDQKGEAQPKTTIRIFPENEALIMAPAGIAIDGTFDIWVTDADNHRICRIDSKTGERTTVAGGTFFKLAYTPPGQTKPKDLFIRKGYHDATGKEAKFNMPMFLALDTRGGDGGAFRCIVPDLHNHVIRFVDRAGKVTTGSGNAEVTVKDGISVAQGGFWDGAKEVVKYNTPFGCTVDAQGNIYVSDCNNWRIRKIDHETKRVSTVAGSGEKGYIDGLFNNAKFGEPTGICWDRLPFTVQRPSQSSVGVPPPPAASASSNQSPAVAAAKSLGTLYVADFANHAIRMVHLDTGTVETLCGGSEKRGFVDGPARQARLNHPMGLCVDSENRILYFADEGNRAIRAVSLKDGTVQTLFTSGYWKRYLLSSDYEVWVPQGNTKLIQPFRTDQTAQQQEEKKKDEKVDPNNPILPGFRKPVCVALDISGALYVADNEYQRVIKFEAPGWVPSCGTTQDPAPSRTCKDQNIECSVM